MPFFALVEVSMSSRARNLEVSVAQDTAGDAPHALDGEPEAERKNVIATSVFVVFFFLGKDHDITNTFFLH